MVWIKETRKEPTVQTFFASKNKKQNKTGILLAEDKLSL